MFKKPFVVLDLETSGVDPKHCDIIEVAAVRYENGKEVARLDDLVKIKTPLPKIITAITGITDEELAEKGKPVDDVLKEAQELIRGAYLVGHNINFDVGFLKAGGVDLDILGLIDTIPLAQIVLPQAVSYSLESLTDDFGISHKARHRAMGDSEATADLFKHLFKAIDSLPRGVLDEIKALLDRSSWDGGAVFEEAKGKKGGGEGADGVGPSTPTASMSQDLSLVAQMSPRKALDPEEILKENGVLSRVFEGYEYRPQQVEMARNVMNAFTQGYHLICEAPTGVGKSIAYLAAAAFMAIQNKSKVVISTNTINLQQQLYEKDIPLLHELYRQETGHAGVRTAVLKGRSHYLCLRRLAEFKRHSRFTDEEMVLLIKILVWQSVTETGDSAEIHLTRPEMMTWDFELCSDKKYCSPIKCKPYGNCYLHKAREVAEDADVIIVNHALLCADLENGGGLLPDYQYLIVDEAHHFEQVSTEAFGVDIGQENVSLPIKLIVNHLQDFLARHHDTLFSNHSVFQSIEQALNDTPDLQQFVDNFFSLVALFTNRHVPESAYVENLLVDRNVLGMQDWLNLGESMGEVGVRVGAWLQHLRQLLDRLLLADSQDIPEQETFTDELLQEMEVLQE
ncbi:MAG: exonuclease domain-containing protein, partial [Candidatus Peregrinibacteria bacterium]